MNQTMPRTVRVTDITARDGFQNIKGWIPTEVKIEIIDALAASGIKKWKAPVS